MMDMVRVAPCAQHTYARIESHSFPGIRDYWSPTCGDPREIIAVRGLLAITALSIGASHSGDRGLATPPSHRSRLSYAHLLVHLTLL
jgi:hypothetical protein